MTTNGQQAAEIIHVIEGTVLVCETCGTTHNVVVGPDPYAADLEGVIIMMALCPPCHQDRCDDI